MAFEADTTQDIMRRVFDATLYALSQSADRAQVFTATLQSAADANGNGTSFDVSGLGTIAVQVLITGAGTTQINFEITIDETNWTAIKGTTVPATSSLASTTIASGVFHFDVSAFSLFRARISNTVGVVSVTVLAAGVAIGTGSLSSDALPTGAATEATQAAIKTAVETALTPFFDSDGDNTAQVLKASAGKLYGLEVSNPNAADAWIQLFNVAAGSVIVGTTTPNLSFLVPAGNGVQNGAMDKDFAYPIQFGTAITYACTTAPTGNGDPPTGLVVNAYYV